MKIDIASVTEALTRLLAGSPRKCILSNPAAKSVTYRRVTLTLIGDTWQAEKRTDTQAFHESVEPSALFDYLVNLLAGGFRQLNLWDETGERQLRITAKGNALCSAKAGEPQPALQAAHNREKSYILREGEPLAVLRDMGIFTAEGRVVSAMYDKYRQINRFLEILSDEAARLPADETLNIIDFGCGKSYLTFIVYHYFTNILGRSVRMTGLDLKPDVIEKCNRAAEKYGYDGLRFVLGDIGGYDAGGDVHVVLTLHACDTATDYALFNAIRWNASLILSVPCCQHELNGQLQSDSLSLLCRYGIIKERAAALMTDAIRANLLECCGYKAQLLEFIDFTHTPKNLLIRAVRAPGRKPAEALSEVERVLAEFHLRPTLYELLQKDGRLGKEQLA